MKFSKLIITNVKSVQILQSRNLMVKLVSKMFVPQHRKLFSREIVKIVTFT